MKVVILAAGIGSRLDETLDHQPKALTQLAIGKSILQFQIDALTQYVSIDHIFVVVGYQKEAIMTAFPNLIFIYNPLYKTENTAKSLLRALNKIEEDVLWLNGDVVFKPTILKQIIDFNLTSMVVNRANVAEEEVKYRADDQGKMIEVSKQVLQPQGEALGINLFKKDDLPLFKQNLDQCEIKDYFEKGIEKGIQQGQQVWSLPIANDECAEIDFPNDLIRVNQLMTRWL